MFAIIETAGAGTTDTNWTICNRLKCTPRQLEAILWVRQQLMDRKIKTSFNFLGIYARPGLYMPKFQFEMHSLFGGGECFCIAGYAAKYLSDKYKTNWNDEVHELDQTNMSSLFRRYNPITGRLSVLKAITNINRTLSLGV